MSLPAVSIFTDGCYLPASRVGAWACYLTWYSNGKFHSCELVKSVPVGARSSERMELMAIVKGLQSLDKTCRATVYTDCDSIVKSMRTTYSWESSNGWPRWAKNNSDLTRELLALMRIHTVNLHWIKAHSRSAANRRCDRLAGKSAEMCAARPQSAPERKGHVFQAAPPAHMLPVPSRTLEVWQL